MSMLLADSKSVHSVVHEGDNFKQVSEFLQHLKCNIHFLLCRQNTSGLNKMTAVLPRMYMSRCLSKYIHC